MLTVPSTDGVRLAVHDLSDDPTGRPLLLCHATGFHGRVWRALAAELPDRRCLALDFRGYGDSTEQEGELRWEGFADDVLAVIDHLGLVDVQAVGHSKGGAALLLAEIARPGTFDRLVCFEPIVFPPAPEGAMPAGENPLATMTRRRREHFDSFEEAIERFGSKPPLGSLRSDVLDDYVRHGFRPNDDGGITLKARREHEARTYDTGSQHGAFAHLSEVACPVEIVHGGDGGFPAVAAPQIADALPDATLVDLSSLGHFGPLEDPVAFAAVVRDFLGDDAGGAS
ncbi:alpha/beta fold hydrolase [Actinospongicola halichondriae]|uniref:alpha/beta fold hydrolase n=1 Tax=Actinospongicola halichondriae TaxID=3236844 RepID=UPI003D3B019F